MGEGSGSDQGRVRNLHAVEDLVAFLQTTENGNGILHRRLVNHDRLEPALQGRVLFDILAVLIQRGGADAVELTPCKHGFEHVSRIHGSIRLACAHDQVQLIDEQNDLSLALADFLQHGFETFFKFAPVFGSGHQSAHIQGENLLILQAFRHVAPDNPLGQSFYHSRFADAGLTDQHRIVFCLTGQNPDHIADLGITSDDRIELLLSGPLHQIGTVLI